MTPKTNAVSKNARGVLVFIRERVTAREAVAWSTVAEVGRDVSFRRGTAAAQVSAELVASDGARDRRPGCVFSGRRLMI